jgi:hypothetical protein
LSATLVSHAIAGRVRPEMLPRMGLIAATLVIPAIWGSKIYIGMSAQAFRNTVLWVLVFAGFAMLLSALRSMLM